MLLSYGCLYVKVPAGWENVSEIEEMPLYQAPNGGMYFEAYTLHDISYWDYVQEERDGETACIILKGDRDWFLFSPEGEPWLWMALTPTTDGRGVVCMDFLMQSEADEVMCRRIISSVTEAE